MMKLQIQISKHQRYKNKRLVQTIQKRYETSIFRLRAGGNAMKIALLAGASGLVGNECLRLLLNDDRYERVITLVRKPLAITHPKLDQRECDFERLANQRTDYLAELLDTEHPHDLFCTLGTTIAKAGSREAFRRVDYEYPLVLAEAASELGIKRFAMVTALGVNPQSKVFYNRVKGEVEMDVSVYAPDFDGIHILRPSLLLGDRAEHRAGERIAVALSPVLNVFLRGSFKKYRAIHAAVVASTLVYVANAPAPAAVHIVESDAIQALYDSLHNSARQT
jgi:uncharacterized protein YbjT (DUF2867 family)